MAHFWNHLGKAALVAAPYIAAPFTGGASLMLTGAANAAEQRWAQHDAEQAIAHGEAPSQFDKWLGLGANVAGIASGVGALGSSLGAGATLANTLGSAASTAGRIGNIANLASNTMGVVEQGKNIAASNNGIGPSDPMMNAKKQAAIAANPRGPNPKLNQDPSAQSGGGYNGMFGPNFGQNQNNPNLADSINQGRMQGLQDVGRLPPIRLQNQYAMAGR